jgi:ubiquinone/menaquinone biosynthesis C-methylase UbiE
VTQCHTAGISWVEGDAQQLPFPDSSFDCYTVAFGIRNVVRVEAALAEAHRVLRPGGRSWEGWSQALSSAGSCALSSAR